MEWISEFFSYVVSLFKIPLTLYGHTFSFWQIFWWTLVAFLMLWFIREVLK